MDWGFASEVGGTYVKVIRFDPSMMGDDYLVLYLLPSDLYLFIGYWERYELTIAAGRWSQHDDKVILNGFGARLHSDAVPFSSIPRKHQREFRIASDLYSPALVAESEHEGWSLLNWQGHYNFLGRFHFFDLKNSHLPGSWNEIEPWAQQFLASCSVASD